jgi:TRAP-type mannitol/chloroaromatic compound transport system permease large subunit
MATIFRSSLVFLGIQVLALALVVIFPVIATGLPDMVYGR